MSVKGDAAKIVEAAEDIFSNLLKKARKETEPAVESELEKLLKKKPATKPDAAPRPGTPPSGIGSTNQTTEEARKGKQLLRFNDAIDAVYQVLNETGSDFKKLDKQRLQNQGVLEMVEDFGNFLYGGGSEKRQLEQITKLMEDKLLSQASKKVKKDGPHRSRKV